jgi:hypothetical protein
MHNCAHTKKRMKNTKRTLNLREQH